MMIRTMAVAACLAMLVSAGVVAAQTTLPPVKVTAPKVGGGDFTCTGTACSSAMNTEQLAAHLKFMKEHASMPEEPLAISSEKFCPALRKNRPKNCSGNKPPYTPDYTPNWSPNGCGTGPLSNWFLSRILNSASSHYSGDLNAPYRGVSFERACNAHDLCWGRAGDRAICDRSFRTMMMSACDTLDSAAGNTCTGFAGLYHSVVASTDVGDAHYARSAEAYECASWMHDMNANGCR